MMSISTSSLVLVVDLGTTGVKCSVWSSSPQKGSVTAATLELLFTSSTRLTDLHRPDLIIETIEACMDDVAQECTKRGDLNGKIGVIGFSTLGMSLVGIDANDQIVAFATYRGELSLFKGNEVSIVNPVIPAETAMRLDPETVGVPKPMHNAFAMPHILHLSSTVARYSTIVSLCLERWTGKTKLPVSLSEASWWGLLDWRKGQWDTNAVAIIRQTIPSRDVLPVLADFDILAKQGIKMLECYTRERWSLLSPDVSLLLGIVDGAASTLGSTPFDETLGIGQICLSVGTSAAVRRMLRLDSIQVSSTTSPTFTALGCFVHVLDANRVVVGGALTDGGSAFDLASRLVKGNNNTTPEDEAQFEVPGEIVCLPFFAASGERAPNWAGPSIPGAFVGIHAGTTPTDLVVATVVGVALRLSEIADRLNTVVISCGKTPARGHQGVFVNGTAGVKSTLWKRALSGAFEADLWRYVVAIGNGAQEHRDDSTARGVALLSLGLMIPSSLALHNDGEERIWTKADESELKKFRKLRDQQRRVYEGLLGSMT